MRTFLMLLIATLSFHANGQVDTTTPTSEISQPTTSEIIDAGIIQTTIEIGSFPNDSKYYRKRGMLYLAIQDYANARNDFDKVISLNGDELAEAYFYRGICNASLGEMECENFKMAKKLGFNTDWNNLKSVCPEL